MPILPLLVEAWIISFLIKSRVAISKIKTNKLNVGKKELHTKFKQNSYQNINREKCETIKTKTTATTKNSIPCELCFEQQDDLRSALNNGYWTNLIAKGDYFVPDF